jgi:hypothetical protein
MMGITLNSRELAAVVRDIDEDRYLTGQLARISSHQSQVGRAGV